MAKSKVFYECGACGHTSVKWLGLCPSCDEWHTFSEIKKEKEDRKKHKIDIGAQKENAVPLRLSEIPREEQERFKTNVGELDRVLGGGLMPSSLILLGGDPGIGKSTLMLHIARTNPELNLLYVAGEESAGQIRQRADRIGIKKSNMKVLSMTDLDKVIACAQDEKPDLLVIDSIQSVYRSQLGSLPGSVQQIRECAAMLQQLAKREGVTTLMIGHVTKEGDIAGPRVLEHMVDTVLQFEGDPGQVHRLLRSIKNRFGPAQEVGVFEMNERGLKEVKNPSSLFLSKTGLKVSGNAVTCVMEGSRPLMTEVQALVIPSSYGTPQRTAGGFDQRRLSLLLAVLEKRAGLQFSGRDVYLNIAGGFRITDTAADLAVVCALVSSYRDRPLAQEMFVVGEVGLGGEIRMIPHLERRIREGSKMGFKKVLSPAKDPAANSISIIGAQYVSQAITLALEQESSEDYSGNV
ncbi:MAG: DNA repair protein RadA [Balneolaceae bacterium]